MTAESTTDIALSNHDFTLPSRSHVQATLQQVEEFRALIQSELREGPDYGTIPGTSKPTLLKPGAEKITKLLGLADTYEITDKTTEWEMGLFQYEVRCSLVSIRTGQLVAQGVGECNSYESKYRYRDAKRKCPECGAEAVIKSKVEYGGGWVCFGKIGGCGAKWGDGAFVIESQKIGRVLNEDPADQVNTILKMAKKRSLTDAALSVGSLSNLFTQDLEDMPSPPQPTQAPQAGAASSPAQTPPPQTASPASSGGSAAPQATGAAPNGNPTRFTTMGDFMAWANGKHGKTVQDVVNLARQLYPNEEIGTVTDVARHKDDPQFIAAVQGARA